MSEIHITRKHHLGLAGARKLAPRWAETAERKLDMDCTYEEGKSTDTVRFKRAGAHGELTVTRDHFELDARLGLLLGMFRERIETEIVANLDQLLAHDDPHAAFEQGLAQHEAGQGKPARKPAAKHEAKHEPKHHEPAKHEAKHHEKVAHAGKAGAKKAK